MAINAFEEVPFSPEENDAQPRVRGTFETIGTAFESAFEETGVGLVSRYMAKRELEQNGARKITPEEANQRFPNMPVPFREAVNPVVAQYLFDRNQEKVDRERKLALGPSDPLTKTAMFGAGIVAHLMDPLEFGAGAITGWGFGAAAGRGIFGARVASAARAVELGVATPKARIIKEGAEALAGNLTENVVQEGALREQNLAEGGTYDISGGVANVAISTLIGTAFHLGIKEGVHSLRAMRRITKTLSPELDVPIMRTVISQANAEVRVDASPILQATARETDVNPHNVGGVFNYEYTPATSTGGKTFYSVVKNIDPDADHVDVGDSYFGGKTLTDNPAVANVSATRSYAEPSVIAEIEAGDMKVLNLNEAAPDDVRAILNPHLEAGDFVQTEVTGVSTREILDSIQQAIDSEILDPEVMIKIKDDLKAIGYEGVMHDGTKRVGVEHGPHNVVELFDNVKGVQRGFRTPDAGVRNQVYEHELEAAKSYREDLKNRTDFDIDRVNEVEKEIDGFDVKAHNKELADLKEKFLEEMKDLDAQGLIDPSLRNEVEAIKLMDADIEHQHKLVKAVSFCVGA